MHPGCAIGEVYLCRAPVDFRKLIDGLSAIVEHELVLNPFGSALYWHRNGFCLWYKRLEADIFAWPRDADGTTQTVTMQELEWLLEGFDLWRNQPHKTPRSAIISSRRRQINGYAAYQRTQTRITSSGNRIPFTFNIPAHHFYNGYSLTVRRYGTHQCDRTRVCVPLT